MPTQPVKIEEVARALKLSTKTVRRDIDRGAPHSMRDGAYRLDIAEYKAWRKGKNLTGEAHRPASSNEELIGQRIRRERAMADYREMENARKRGELVPAEHLREAFTAQAAKLRNLIEDLQRAGMREAADMAREAINEIVNDVEERLQHLPDAVADAGVGGAGDPAAIADDAGVRGAGDHPADGSV